MIVKICGFNVFLYGNALKMINLEALDVKNEVQDFEMIDVQNCLMFINHQVCAVNDTIHMVRCLMRRLCPVMVPALDDYIESKKLDESMMRQYNPLKYVNEIAKCKESMYYFDFLLVDYDFKTISARLRNEYIVHFEVEKDQEPAMKIYEKTLSNIEKRFHKLTHNLFKDLEYGIYIHGDVLSWVLEEDIGLIEVRVGVPTFDEQVKVKTAIYDKLFNTFECDVENFYRGYKFMNIMVLSQGPMYDEYIYFGKESKSCRVDLNRKEYNPDNVKDIREDVFTVIPYSEVDPDLRLREKDGLLRPVMDGKEVVIMTNIKSANDDVPPPIYELAKAIYTRLGGSEDDFPKKLKFEVDTSGEFYKVSSMGIYVHKSMDYMLSRPMTADIKVFGYIDDGIPTVRVLISEGMYVNK